MSVVVVEVIEKDGLVNIRLFKLTTFPLGEVPISR